METVRKLEWILSKWGVLERTLLRNAARKKDRNLRCAMDVNKIQKEFLKRICFSKRSHNVGPFCAHKTFLLNTWRWDLICASYDPLIGTRLCQLVRLTKFRTFKHRRCPAIVFVCSWFHFNYLVAPESRRMASGWPRHFHPVNHKNEDVSFFGVSDKFDLQVKYR